MTGRKSGMGLGCAFLHSQVMSTVFANVHDWSGLPPTPEGLRQRSEPTLRAKNCLPRRKKSVDCRPPARSEMVA